MRELKERLLLKYGDQAEFIRFRELALDSNTRIKQLYIEIERQKQIQDEALAEIERMFNALSTVSKKV